MVFRLWKRLPYKEPAEKYIGLTWPCSRAVRAVLALRFPDRFAGYPFCPREAGAEHQRVRPTAPKYFSIGHLGAQLESTQQVVEGKKMPERRVL